MEGAEEDEPPPALLPPTVLDPVDPDVGALPLAVLLLLLVPLVASLRYRAVGSICIVVVVAEADRGMR